MIKTVMGKLENIGIKIKSQTHSKQTTENFNQSINQINYVDICKGI